MAGIKYFSLKRQSYKA